MRKNWLSLALCLCMVMLIAPILSTPTEAAYRGSDFATGILAERLDTIINKGITGCVTPSLPPVGSSLSKNTVYQTTYANQSGSSSDYTCVAYARAAYSYLFGYNLGVDQYRVEFKDAKGTNSLSYQQFISWDLKCGAYLRTTNSATGKWNSSEGHSLIILSYDDSKVVTLEGNHNPNTGSIEICTYSWNSFNNTHLCGRDRYVCSLSQPLPSVYEALTNGTIAKTGIAADDVVFLALDLVGKYPYVSGGESPSEGGFDCTGLMYYIYHTRLGMDMTLNQARSKSGLAALGTKIFDKNDLLPGDVVQMTYGHVVIYIGNNQIVEAAKPGTNVRKQSFGNISSSFEYGIRFPDVVQGATSQKPLSSQTTEPVSGNAYYIEAYCGKVVEVEDSKTGNGANVQIWAKSSRDLGCQKFYITQSGNYYTLTATHSNKVIDVADGSAASGTNIWQYTNNGTDAQKWQFEDAGGGYYYIRSALGTYMDAASGGTANGTNIWAYGFNGSDAQKFRLVDAATGRAVTSNTAKSYTSAAPIIQTAVSDFSIRLDKSTYTLGETVTMTPSATGAGSFIASIWYGDYSTGTCVYFTEVFTQSTTYKPDKAGNYTIHMDAYDARGQEYGYISTDQSFNVVAATSDVTPAYIAEGDYMLTPACAPSARLEVGGIEDGANARIWTANGSDPQIFRFMSTDSGYYSIMTEYTGYVLDVYNWITDSGTNVALYHNHSGANQQWMLNDVGGGYYEIISRLSNNICLDVNGAGSVDGTNVQIWERNGTDAQKWKLTPVAANNTTKKNVSFPKPFRYTQGQFTDVPANQWFTAGVAEAFELGLMKGNSASTFNPYGDVTISEAVTMAARIHSIYANGSETIRAAGKGEQWYQPYLDYAYENGVIRLDYYNCDVSQRATRAQFAEIFAGALPDEALAAVNSVGDGAIPDVHMSESYASHVYKLYRAGILAGSDVNGTFHPATFITRSEAATIVSRMAVSDNRVSLTLN